MSSAARVTVTLPMEVVQDIDRQETNRSKFVLEAIRRELRSRRRKDLRRSLQEPHGEAAGVAEAGFDAWADGLPADDATALVDAKAGIPLLWLPGKGWTKAK